MKTFSAFLLIAPLLLATACSTGGSGSGPAGDDDDVKNPGPLPVPTNNGPVTPLPDLTVDRPLLEDSLSFGIETPTGPNDCEVVEGCLVGDAGPRNVLRFDVGVVNLGKVDLVVGDPDSHPEDFLYSPCHQHYHHKGFADYTLKNAADGVVATGRKQAFCLMDIQDYGNNGDTTRDYDCGNQGISVGWEDVYDKSLDCQFVDITDLPAGDYTLSITVNAEHRIQESGPAPNTVSVPVTLN